jgi:hypothetical protein
MAAGVLSYLLIMHFSGLATWVSTLLGYAIGLRDLPLTLLACAMQATSVAAIGAFAWWYFVARAPSETPTKRAPTLVRFGLFAACAIVAVFWAERLGTGVLYPLPMHGISQVLLAQAWMSLAWSMLLPFLLVGLIALRTHRHTQVR